MECRVRSSVRAEVVYAAPSAARGKDWLNDYSTRHPFIGCSNQCKFTRCQCQRRCSNWPECKRENIVTRDWHRFATTDQRKKKSHKKWRNPKVHWRTPRRKGRHAHAAWFLSPVARFMPPEKKDENDDDNEKRENDGFGRSWRSPRLSSHRSCELETLLTHLGQRPLRVFHRNIWGSFGLFFSSPLPFSHSMLK